MLLRQGMLLHKIKNFKRGFTLIELLVVIAIVAILSSIVLISVDNARDKTADSVIIQDLEAVQTQAEIYYQKNKSYTLSGNVSGITCPSALQSYNNLLFKNDSKIREAITHAMSRVKSPNFVNSSFCGASPISWVVAIRLKTSPMHDDDRDRIWCVDAEGQSKVIAGPVNYFVFSDGNFPIKFKCP